MKLKIALLAAAVVVASAAPAQAVTVLLHSSNVGITSMNYTVTGNTVDIYETWGNVGRGFLELRGLDASVDYTINKHITNNTGADWSRFANELLDPGVDPADPQPQPAWVPANFSTSSDLDGLSFAQGSGLPRTSTAFSSLLVDELTDARDFLDFYNGSVSGAGGTDLVTFGIRDNLANNQPFLLAQRPNESSIPDVPEPTTLLLLGGGLMAGAAARRRRRQG